MGLCLSINREFRYLVRHNGEVKKRTFQGHTRLVRLVEIYDGDTFKIQTRLDTKEPLFQYSLRLAGLDAPEMKPLMSVPDRDLHKKAATAVRDQLRQLYSPGTIFLVDFDREDKYGRLLGTIWTVKNSLFGTRKSVNVCQMILRRGWALPYDGNKKTEFNKEMLESCS